MGTSCQLDCSDEDDRMLDEARNYVCDLDHENFEKSLPAIKAALAERCVVCLEENAENVRNSINEQLAQQEELTEIDRLDQEVLPTHQQFDEMVRVGQELGISEPDIIATPLICGTLGVEDMDEKIRDVMEALHTSKIPSIYRDDVVISKIMFVDKEEEGPTGVNKLADFNHRTKVLHIFKTEEGVFPTKETIKWTILPHETFHANKLEFMARIMSHKDEWTLVNLAEKQFPSKYVGRLEEAYLGGDITTDLRDEELAAEWYRKYLSGDCSEKTTKFFDKFFFEEEENE